MSGPSVNLTTLFLGRRGWLGGAMILGKLPVPGRPTNLDDSRTRAYCACSRCGWGGLDIFTLYLFTPLSPSLWETARYRLKYCLKGPDKPKTIQSNPILGRLRPPKRLTSTSCTYFRQQLTTALLESAKGETKVCGQTWYRTQDL